MMRETYPDLKGAACVDLPPLVRAKYFDADAGKERFRAQTAKAICGKCAVRAVCLEAALKDEIPAYGVVGGLTASELRTLRAWEEYDHGVIDKEPARSRPLPPAIETPAMQNTAEYRRTRDLSFEERVYGVFLDVKQGKYETLNAAIGKIALIHEYVLRDMQMDEGNAA
jgi:hypothetical protein